MSTEAKTIALELQMALEALHAGVQQLQTFIQRPSPEKEALLDQIKDLVTRQQVFTLQVDKSEVFAGTTGERPQVNEDKVESLLADMHKLLSYKYLQERLGSQVTRVTAILQKAIESASSL